MPQTRMKTRGVQAHSRQPRLVGRLSGGGTAKANGEETRPWIRKAKKIVED